MGISSSSSSNAPWKGAQPYLTSGGSAVQDAYFQNAGGIQNATNQVTSLLPDVIQKYQQGNPAINAATDYNTDVLAGKYLDQGNPYLQQITDQVANQARNQTAGALGVKGLTGGSDYTKLVSQGVSNAVTPLLYQNYSNERQAMSNAASQAPGLAAADTLQITPMLSLLQAYQQPLNAAETYAGSLGNLFGSYQTKTSNPSLADSIGKGISAVSSIASLFSDRRLKTDIRRVGRTDGGLPVYTYRYKGDAAVHMGVMAQDVADMQPQALGPEVGGFATVFYGEVR